MALWRGLAGCFEECLVVGRRTWASLRSLIGIPIVEVIVSDYQFSRRLAEERYVIVVGLERQSGSDT
jgi:hypothetical protein